jgi:hypothetical protein
MNSSNFFETGSGYFSGFILAILSTLLLLIIFIINRLFEIKARLHHPKIIVQLINGSRMCSRANDNIYTPLATPDIFVVSYEKKPSVEFEWNLTWHFTLKLTNSSTYKTFITSISPESSNVHQINIEFKFKSDSYHSFTTTFVRNRKSSFTDNLEMNLEDLFIGAGETIECELICTTNIRGSADYADYKIKKYPFDNLVIQYRDKMNNHHLTLYSADENISAWKNKYLSINYGPKRGK